MDELPDGALALKPNEIEVLGPPTEVAMVAGQARAVYRIRHALSAMEVNMVGAPVLLEGVGMKQRASKRGRQQTVDQKRGRFGGTSSDIPSGEQSSSEMEERGRRRQSKEARSTIAARKPPTTKGGRRRRISPGAAHSQEEEFGEDDRMVKARGDRGRQLPRRRAKEEALSDISELSDAMSISDSLSEDEELNEGKRGPKSSLFRRQAWPEHNSRRKGRSMSDRGGLNARRTPGRRVSHGRARAD